MSDPAASRSRWSSVANDVVRTRGRGFKHFFSPALAERIVVFESDDWGSRRIPSKGAAAWLEKAVPGAAGSPYHRESIETAADITALCEMLGSVRGADGRAPGVTCFVNPANPDFERIREADFERYFPEPFSKTLERRGDCAETLAVWQQAHDSQLLVPEYHGREHLQVRLWLAHLQQPGLVREAFERGIYAVPAPALPPLVGAFRAAYYFDSFDELPGLRDILLDGAALFSDLFGRSPRIFCPPNNVFHPEMDDAVEKAGCRSIVRPLRGKQPDGRGGGRKLLTWRSSRQPGLHISRRNAIFEPVMGAGVEHALRGIQSAFDWGRPAIISTHRVNYAGELDPAMAARGLKALGELLKSISARWPDVQFRTSSELAEQVRLT